MAQQFGSLGGTTLAGADRGADVCFSFCHELGATQGLLGTGEATNFTYG